MAQYLVHFGILLIVCIVCGSHDWSYEGNRGPTNWRERFHTCEGNQQSPINIEERHIKDIALPALKFSGLNAQRSLLLSNNGHTVMLSTNESKVVTIAGGPLDNSIYVFEQLHFHWGAKDTEGSENLINNHTFAMELHAVFYKKDYDSMEAALKHSDGLIVLGYLYETNEESNPTYEAIVDVLPGLEVAGTIGRVQEPLILNKLLTPQISTIDHYFTYSGSLTTPPCLEIVKWITFKETQFLSSEQLAAFRKIRSLDGEKLTHNFRPVQPLAGRIVFQNTPFTDESNDLPSDQHHHHNRAHDHPDDSHSGQIGIRLSILVLLAAFLLAI